MLYAQTMHDVELTVRSPTGAAWLCNAFFMIVTGEIYFEIQNKTVHHLLGHTFSSGEATPLIIGSSLAFVVSLVWLLSLYLRPGKIKINQHRGILSRVRFTPFGTREVTESIERWAVTISFFSQNDLKNQVFKKILLGTSSHQEVILYSDVPHGDQLLMALNGIKSRLKRHQIEIKPLKAPIN